MPDQKQPTRREFLKQASVFSAGAVTLPAALNPFSLAKPGEGDGFTFLFQGDSITDGNRIRSTDWNHVLGHGYVYLIAAGLGYNSPAKRFNFFNRGISGNKITDLSARWQPDTIEIKPDLLSILIGINDSTAAVYGNKDFTVASFESGYRSLLEQTKKQLPAVELVICEPFVFPVGKVKEKWAEYQAEVIPRQQVAKKLAEEFKAIYVPFQQAFDQALKKAPEEYWMWDGIHPMPAGHEVMAREWTKQVGMKLKFIRS